MIARFGFGEAEKWCRANNLKPLISIRPNCLRTDPDRLIERLHNEGIGAIRSPVVPGMLRVVSGGAPAASASFRDGLFTIQGESSALVAPILSLETAGTVIDLCSAPGGKTTHLAELAGDCGRVYAVELHSQRLELVNKAANRLGLRSIIPVLADGRHIEKENFPAPDAVLVDAPCSGLGVIRRLPEIKWSRKEQDLLRMQALQLDLLSAAADLLLPGGKLLYSVCTTEIEETLQVTEIFNRSHPDFSAVPPLCRLQLPFGPELSETEPLFLWPHRHDLDGFYISLWRKKA
jgi:16S rRNA (cytosine967-C5)-methyltransferase